MIRKAIKDDFVKNSFIFFVGSMIAAFLSYLYHPILGRLMNLEDFGEMQALISLFTQFSIISSTFSIVVVNIIANSDNVQEGSHIITQIRKILLGILAVIFVISLIFNQEIKNFLRFTDFVPFIFLFGSLFISTLLVFRNSYLQGVKNFKAVSLSGIIASGGRLIFATLLVALGWKVMGAVVGLLVSQIIALAYVYAKTKDNLQSGLDFSLRQLAKSRIKKELRYGLLVFFVYGCVAFLSAADVIFVKHFFPPATAGLYGGVSTIARIVFFATSPIAGVMLSSIKIKAGLKKNSLVFLKALIISSAIGLGVLLTFSIFSATVIQFMIGAKYLPLAHILAKLSLIFFIVALDNLLFCFFLSLRRYYLAGVSVIGISLVLALNYLRHNNVDDILQNFLSGASLVLAMLVVSYAVEWVNTGRARRSASETRLKLENS